MARSPRKGAEGGHRRRSTGASGPVVDVRGSDGAGVGRASATPPDPAGHPYGGPSPVVGLGFDGAFIGPLVTVQMIGGSPCYTVAGTPTAWYENWMRA